MGKKTLRSIVIFLFTTFGFAQPYTDIASFTYQHFASHYKDNPELKNQTDNYLLNVLYPKQFKNGNVFLFRINAEMLHSSINIEGNNSSDVSSIAMPIGFQWVSKNKKWKTLLMGIPKLASNFESALTTNDFQYGGLLLENYVPNQNLKLKFGLYYNREAFGNFFVPLLGVDWKASERIYLYGILPSNYKIEYNLIKNKVYTGLDFKWLTRSFNLSDANPDNYMRFEEVFLKGFVECFLYKNILVSAAAGYSFGKSPLQYTTATDEVNDNSIIYAPLKKYPVFNIGIFYRIRNDAGK
ncbi:MAG: hypothetical protein V4648_05305 [Bacteroidota bacterium]